MTPQKLLYFAEFPFQQIGRIRDTQVGKTLIGKQPWQMPFQAVVGGAQDLCHQGHRQDYGSGADKHDAGAW